MATRILRCGRSEYTLETKCNFVGGSYSAKAANQDGRTVTDSDGWPIIIRAKTETEALALLQEWLTAHHRDVEWSDEFLQFPSEGEGHRPPFAALASRSATNR